jgi:hypothetical protein
VALVNGRQRRRSGPPGCRISLNGKTCTERIPLSALDESGVNRVAAEFD